MFTADHPEEGATTYPFSRVSAIEECDFGTGSTLYYTIIISDQCEWTNLGDRDIRSLLRLDDPMIQVMIECGRREK